MSRAPGFSAGFVWLLFAGSLLAVPALGWGGPIVIAIAAILMSQAVKR